MKQFAKKVARSIGLRRSGVSSGVTPVGVDGALLRVFAKAKTYRNLRRSHDSADRRLEIGPGPQRIPGVETVNIIDGPQVDYVLDATKKLPFPSNTFSLVYASHILEHVAWYQTMDVLREWVRILKPGGALEIWVPNGLKICKAFVDAEYSGLDPLQNDPWTRFNEERDPCKWASGRIFTYGDGTGSVNDPNWHRAVFSPRYLRMLMENASLQNVMEMDRKEVRGFDHGWINLGMKGTKPN